ncbi:hypothetical protein SAMN04487770_12138 [Butyrivibrio sp. ob235]|uniref:hypothetical protein n=1 Tax=Butyrivibrio sp. ob235 TaxID=1761780 RepID=UPI0008B02DF0|nr:hypothetical protein [Butyrivibrio sp. ob235]SEL93519.1 hypothetical protein SAMN04487770_12138 [Butyrivibrio sp. ob235]
MKRRVWQRVLSLALLFAMTIILVNPVTAQAKTKKLKLPYAEFNIPQESYIESKAVTINKTGNYKVQLGKSGKIYSGFIKFVVPKTKKYTFTYSHLRAKGKSSCLATVDYTVPTGIEDQIKYLDGYSKGGYLNSYPFAYRIPGKKGRYNVASRKVTYQLTEGQVVYINIYNTYTNTRGPKVTFNLKIK